jgi:hypothetical protein
MPALLQQSIEDMLFRNQEGQFMPRLTLKGFGWKEHEIFPANWNITTEQWFEEEIKGIEEEWREAQEYGAPLIDLESLDGLTEGWDEY